MNRTGPDWERLSPLFDELVEADSDARERRLREIADTDAVLAEELRRMLAADAARSGLLDRDMGQAALGGLAGESQAGADRSGTRIDDYRLERALGRGGMGEVYLATRVAQGFEQRVALKLMRRGVDTEDAVRRFAQERRILARLEHPNIARLIDGGLSADGVSYLVMELVEGVPITQYADAAGLDVDQRLRLLQSACAAVDYAHRQLIVHRDLKPSNILVTGDGTVKLLDFGIAKLLEPGDGEELQTGSAMRALSPAYAAPEQILGEPISTAADVYALGVVLYEMLTGQLPHRRLSASIEQLVQGLTTEQPLAPSAALRQQARAAAGEAAMGTTRRARRAQGDLDTIVLKALAREPERRYGSPAALAEDIERFLSGRPIAARADTLGYRLNRFVRRHRGGVAASLITLLALIGGFGFALWEAKLAQEQAQRADREAKRAEAEARSAKEMTARATRVKEFLVSIFLQEDPLRRDARGALTLAQAFDDALARIDTELAGDPALQGDLLDDFGEIVAGKGDFAKAQTLFERALATAEKVRGPDDLSVAESLISLGVIAGYRGNASAGRANLERAVRILEAHADTGKVSLPGALSALANIEYNEGRNEQAVAGFRRALEISRARGVEDLEVLAIMSNLAGALSAAGQYEEAEPLLSKVVAATERQWGRDSVKLVQTLRLLALNSYQRGRMDEELAHYERALKLARAAYAADHPWVADALTDTGWCLVRRGGYAEGDQRLREALAMYERLGNKGRMPTVLRSIGLSQQRQNDHAAALATLDRGWAMCKGTKIESAGPCLLMRASRAQLLALEGQGENALSEADATLEAMALLKGKGADERAQAMEARASALLAVGRTEEAAATQRAALQGYIAIYAS